MKQAFFEYVWLDGGRGDDDPMQRLRSKTRVFTSANLHRVLSFRNVPDWNFDGSSTGQSDGDSADLPLKPVRLIRDPFRDQQGCFIVLCEVMTKTGAPHETNRRAKLAALLEEPAVKEEAPWLGFEQEYMLLTRDGNPLGFVNGFAPPQGPYYCGVGAREAFGREIMEDHLQACVRAGINIVGTNAEVCPGQWEFQIGPDGVNTFQFLEPALTFCDDLVLARYLLHRVGEKHGFDISLDVKPKRGDWNGSGCHTNFSTKTMREANPSEALMAFQRAIARLEDHHDLFMTSGAYGHNLHERLTGRHETCSIKEFKSGESNRGASVRVPNHVMRSGNGYFEDRRPGANCDPYRVATAMISTILGKEPIV